MNQVSVIIVNYNVKYFLEQALSAVMKACNGLCTEVWVVDNASSDGSASMIKEKYPSVHLIESDENLGFSKANNLAIKKSNSQYVLLLNPDTIIEESTLKDCFTFMESHKDCGAMGVKMLDGSGQFLPESKRALPTPRTAFFKMSGFARLFPKSEYFGKYHLSYLDKEKTHEIDVLSGAFMFIRKEALDKSGLLDERFFMYGEDIDLSYRIKQNGYKNYYFPGTSIIHFKGESTKKNSLNYVKMFYNAMLLFYKKHFSGKYLSLLSTFIQVAIYLRAGLSLINRIFVKLWPVFLDVSVLYGGMFLLTDYWEKNHRYVEGGKYPPEYLGIMVPVYIIAWLFSIYLNGGYDPKPRIYRILRGVLIGTVLIVVIYAFLPESWRFSRALIILGMAWACFSLSVMRFIYHLLTNQNIYVFRNNSPRTIIVGSDSEAQRVLGLLNRFNAEINYLGRLGKTENLNSHDDYIGELKFLPEYVNLYNAKEVIFCSKDTSYSSIINMMNSLSQLVSFKIVPEEGFSAIGSRNKNSTGELYTMEVSWAIDTKENKRQKRLFDIIISVIFLICFPYILFRTASFGAFLNNLFNVISGNKTWVGFGKNNIANNQLTLPKLKAGILPPVPISKFHKLDPNTIRRINLLYAKEYHLLMDLNLIWKNLRYLDHKY